MGFITQAYLESFWSRPMMEVSLLVGYERAYHGRAAGMRTYGIVCMASAALTVFAGYPGFWWGGAGHGGVDLGRLGDRRAGRHRLFRGGDPARPVVGLADDAGPQT